MKLSLLIFFKSVNSDLWIWDNYPHLIKGMDVRKFPAKRCIFFFIRMW